MARNKDKQSVGQMEVLYYKRSSNNNRKNSDNKTKNEIIRCIRIQNKKKYTQPKPDVYNTYQRQTIYM